MSSFKVGDKVSITNSGSLFTTFNGFAEKYGMASYKGAEGFNSTDEFTVVCVGKHMQTPSYEDLLGIQNKHGFQYIIESTGVKLMKCNGVDAEGNAMYFDMSSLKSFMRATTKNGAQWIVAERGRSFLISNQEVDGARPPNWAATDHYGEWEIVEVYESPRDEYEMLDVQAKGKLIWRRTPQKTAQEIAIEDAEKALKVAQEKLEELKRSFAE